MAEITGQISINISNGHLLDDIKESMEIEQTAARGPHPGFQTIGTTYEAVTFPDLASPGLIFIKNIDPTNYVQWGTIGEEISGTQTVFIPVGKLLAGEWCVFRLEPTCDFYMKANTAACGCVIKCYDS